MKLSEHCRYIGRMRQPLQYPEFDCPTMFMASDSLKHELDLILLTPSSFLHAYKFIIKYNAKSVRLFIPSLRPEFISDIVNLYLLLKDKVPIAWVFPEKIDHYTLSLGQIVTTSYANKFNKALSITYVKNSNVNDVYDLIVRSTDSVHYFSFYTDEKKARELFTDDRYDIIHVPMSATLYGGLTYVQLLNINIKYRRKFMPDSFISVEELYKFMGRDVPSEKYYKYYGDDEDEHSCPPDFDGPITDEEIINMMEDVPPNMGGI